MMTPMTPTMGDKLAGRLRWGVVAEVVFDGWQGDAETGYWPKMRFTGRRAWTWHGRRIGPWRRGVSL